MQRTVDDVVKQAYKVIDRLEKEHTNDIYYYDKPLAQKYIKFIAMLKHTAGEFAGVNFQILDFQTEFVTVSLCVKRRDTKRRRYKSCMLFIPRKSGKTELLAAILLVMFFLDKEKGKEIYTMASETEQAKIIYNAAYSMIKQTGYFETMINAYKSTRSIVSKGEFNDVLKVLTANADTKDGLRANCAVADEGHSYKDDSLYKVIEESMISRLEPIIFLISTAGYLINGWFHQRYEYAKKVQKGIIKDESFYSMIFEADPDKWQEEAEWIKANPALGYGVKLDNLRDMYTRAMHSGTEEVSFKTKHLNIWTNSSETFIADHTWVSNMVDRIDIDLTKLKCWGGLDLSSTTDITSFYLVFEYQNKIIIKGKNYLPSEKLREKARNDNVPYQTWVKEGFLTITEGNVVDYDVIQADIEAAFTKYNIQGIAFDRWNSSSLISRLLEKRVTMLAFGQGFASMSAPTKQLEKLALEKNFISDDPMLRWAISNIALQKDPAGNIKPAKDKVKQKIDPAVALIMALGLYIPDMQKESAYLTRGLRSL
jgi:phage terminase large subunit-like protein